MGPVVPTERLRLWRAAKSDKAKNRGQRLGILRQQDPANVQSQNFGVRGRLDWQIEFSTFVTVPGQTTRVIYCPSAQQLHELCWNEDYGRGES